MCEPAPSAEHWRTSFPFIWKLIPTPTATHCPGRRPRIRRRWSSGSEDIATSCGAKEAACRRPGRVALLSRSVIDRRLGRWGNCLAKPSWASCGKPTREERLPKCNILPYSILQATLGSSDVGEGAARSRNRQINRSAKWRHASGQYETSDQKHPLPPRPAHDTQSRRSRFGAAGHPGERRACEAGAIRDA